MMSMSAMRELAINTVLKEAVGSMAQKPVKQTQPKKRAQIPAVALGIRARRWIRRCAAQVRIAMAPRRELSVLRGAGSGIGKSIALAMGREAAYSGTIVRLGFVTNTFMRVAPKAPPTKSRTMRIMGAVCDPIMS
jgi:hypothetical protein